MSFLNLLERLVYRFGGRRADGNAGMKETLGGKGANLAEMASMGLPVPPGFTIPTGVCTYFYAHDRQLPPTLTDEVKQAMNWVEETIGNGLRFGSVNKPLLVSVRSGARASMPGMMDTVLNVGLTEATLPALIRATDNEWFAWDSYRRLIMMYADVVMDKAAGKNLGIREELEGIMTELKAKHGYKADTDLTVPDLQFLVSHFKAQVFNTLGEAFPDDAETQLWGAIRAVFQSWNGQRALDYRKIEKIPHEWGTAVNVQTMVFGNMGSTSGTGVAFTRNPSTGENEFFGEYLFNAQGEDVVAGIRTPLPISALRDEAPESYMALMGIRKTLEERYRDMLDIEFTIQQGQLFMLQCRVGKRNGPAAVRMAVEMVEQGTITREEALMRVTPKQLNELLYPSIDPKEEKRATQLASGLAAGPGAATGMAVFSAHAAEAWAAEGKPVILIRALTSPEDVMGMRVSQAIVTQCGGMTSHAAVVARGWGKCCVVGCKDLDVNAEMKFAKCGTMSIREGDWITVNGSNGKVYKGKLATVAANPDTNPYYRSLMGWADEVRTLKVRANAESPEDAIHALKYGAEGIGLCRTEHMFFGDERLLAMREMIVAKDTPARERALAKLLPHQQQDFEGLFRVMKGLPVTIRLLDPPLHEFLPEKDDEIVKLAEQLGLSIHALRATIARLHELNPMLGHRGCRLGISYPEITRMQARAIFQAAAEVGNVKAEIMIPLVGGPAEFLHQAKLVREVAGEVQEEQGIALEYSLGCMIETPRAALVAGDIVAAGAEFASFGTNDLTQTALGVSRDDIGSFLPTYLDEKIWKEDPFVTIDKDGVGQLVSHAVETALVVNPAFKLGICGEHGGDPDSVEFFHEVGLDYVSCSPFRLPLARLAAARAALKQKSS